MFASGVLLLVLVATASGVARTTDRIESVLAASSSSRGACCASSIVVDQLRHLGRAARVRQASRWRRHHPQPGARSARS